jgi:hypothetical protein
MWNLIIYRRLKKRGGPIVYNNPFIDAYKMYLGLILIVIHINFYMKRKINFLGGDNRNHLTINIIVNKKAKEIRKMSL